MVYIHYGAKEFDPCRFRPIANVPHWNKPVGGFWASPVGAELGWRDWCECEEFRLEELRIHFRFLITPAARVFHLRSVEDLARMPRCDYAGIGYTGVFYPDFEQMVRDGWDAIELHLSEDGDFGWDSNGLYWQLYGWDCDSILVMNPKVISPLTHI